LIAASELRRAHELCQQLPAECQRLGMPRNALLALAHLKECEEAGRLNPKETEHVRVFLQRASNKPDLAFLPLGE